jgi:hypothetical protein
MMSKEDLEEKMFWDAADFARDDLEHAVKTMTQMVKMERAHRAQFKGAIDWAEDPMVKLRDRLMAVLNCYEVYVDDLAAVNGRPAGDYWQE